MTNIVEQFLSLNAAVSAASLEDFNKEQVQLNANIIDALNKLNEKGTGVNTPGNNLITIDSSEVTAYTISPNVYGRKQLVGVDTTDDPVTISLPLTARLKVGDTFEIEDTGKNSNSNNITIDRNGNTINGLTSDITINTDGAKVILVYFGSGNFIVTYNSQSLYTFNYPLSMTNGVVSFGYSSSFFDLVTNELSIKNGVIGLTQLNSNIWTTYTGDFGTSGGSKPANIYTANISSATGNFSDHITMSNAKQMKSGSNYVMAGNSGNSATSAVGSHVQIINSGGTNNGTYSFGLYAGSGSTLVFKIDDRGKITQTTSQVVSTNFYPYSVINGLTVYYSNGTDPNGVLTGSTRDICIGCPEIKRCTGGTTWVTVG